MLPIDIDAVRSFVLERFPDINEDVFDPIEHLAHEMAHATLLGMTPREPNGQWIAAAISKMSWQYQMPAEVHALAVERRALVKAGMRSLWRGVITVAAEQHGLGPDILLADVWSVQHEPRIKWAADLVAEALVEVIADASKERQ